MSFEKVSKRNGSIVDFDSNKIIEAIAKAGKATSEFEKPIASLITKVVLQKMELEQAMKNIEMFSIEQIQDIVEKVLLNTEYKDTAKAYMLYRDDRRKMREVVSTFHIDLISKYVDNDDWRIKENSNTTYSLQGLHNYMSSKLSTQYWLNHVYPTHISNAHNSGAFHIHDLGILAPYCCGWDLQDLLLLGFTGVPSKISSKPAKHLRTALGQLVNFTFTVQGEVAGAQAVSNFDTLLAPFVYYDNLNYTQVKQAIQEFVFNINVPTRVGFQCVPDTYECLTPSGWKTKDQLKLGEPIYVVDMETKKLKLDTLLKVNEYDYDDYMVTFSNRKLEFSTTCNHRQIRKSFNSTTLFGADRWVMDTAEELACYKTPIDIPLVHFGLDEERKGVDFTNDEIELLAWALSDCHMDKKASRLRIYQSPKKHAAKIAALLKRLDCDWYASPAGGGGYGDIVHRFDVKGTFAKKILEYTDGNRESIPEDFIMNATVDQIKVFLEIYVLADGYTDPEGNIDIYKKNDHMADCLQRLLFLSGYASRRVCRKDVTDTVAIYKYKYASMRTSYSHFTGKVWCPTTSTGTFVCRTPQKVPFLTGNSPFFNLTMDLQCPEMFKDKPVMYDGKYQTEVYGQFQKEMNMINKAFCEVMIEGDASGRIFTFPIPTYNIDKTFDWDNEDYDIIFAMAGKHGNPYFANYCGSDMNPEDARSMCPLHGKTKVWVKTAEDGIRRRSLQYVYDKLRDVPIQANYLSSWVDVKIIEVKPELFYKVTLRGGYTTTFESRHEQPVKYAFDDEEQTIIKAKDIKVGMLIPIGKDFGDTNIEYKMVRKVERLLPLENERAFCFEVQGDEAPFFQLANGLVTHNCRLRIDNRELIRRGGGLFGSSPKTGSLNVVTINLARLGYESNSEEDFKRRLDILLEYAKETCVIKRKVINKFTEQGMYPYAAFYLKDTKARTGSCWTNHFNTIGVNGMNEACLNLFGKEFNIGTEKGKQFALNIMNHMRDKLISFQEETNEMFNLEATPAESTAYSLALKDKKIYPDIISASVNEDIPFYTNSTHLPVNFTDDMFELLDLQDELQTKYTGGTVIHIFLGEEVRDPKMVKHMTRKVCENYKLPYFSWTPTFSTCDNHGYLAGEHKDCPHCGGETEVYSRVVGYYRPTRSWNESKQIEFDMRKTFKI